MTLDEYCSGIVGFVFFGGGVLLNNQKPSPR